MPKAQLLELFARGLGVIEEARIGFGPGFNVITGETGAGKTLLLGALELCLGGDAVASRYALNPDTRAIAVFDRGDGRDIVFSRESVSGRLRASLDDAPTSAEVLRQRARDVIVIHGQHDSLALRSRGEVLRLIDAAGAISSDGLDAVRREIDERERERASLGGDEQTRARERDFLDFQCREIDAARLRSGDELEEVLEELTRMSSLRDAHDALLSAAEALDGDGDGAILNRFAEAISGLPREAGVDDLRADLANALEAARANVHELRERAAPDFVDPERLAQLEERASVLRQISRKYGGSLSAALEQLDAFSRRIAEIDGAQGRLSQLEAELGELKRREVALAAELRREREASAQRLTDRVARQLPRVALPNARLRFVVEGVDGSLAHIVFAPNPGWPEGPLSSLASGGELSRVLLALSLETAHDDVVAVFDEVDAGVGGQVAQQIGDCLREVGASQQVIAVTHLASVAAKAAHHFVIEKTVADGATRTRVREVRGEERVREIARMLAGDAQSAEAAALARRLLESVP